MEQIYEFLGKVVAVGGTAAAISYAIFVFVGKKWLEQKFSERLAAYKHEQQKELEKYRYKINSEFNRITKIHEKEIEILPEAWILLQDSVAQIKYFISPMRSYPNLDALDEEQLEEYLAKSDFQEWEKREFRESSQKNTKYHERIFYHELNDARASARKFHVFIQKNRIFLSSDLKQLFTEIDDLLWNAMTDKEIVHDTKDRSLERKSYSEVTEEVTPLIKRVEELVQKRLHYDEAS